MAQVGGAVRLAMPGAKGAAIGALLGLLAAAVAALVGLLLPLLPEAAWLPALGAVYRPLLRLLPPKFSSPQSFTVVVAGGAAGKFSAFLPGFGVGLPPRPTAHMSRATTIPVEPPPPSLDAAAAPSFSRPSAERRMSFDGLQHDEPAERRLMDPTGERQVEPYAAAPRFGLEGEVALLDISKAKGDRLLARIERRLTREHPRVSTRRFAKPAFSKPLPPDLRAEIASSCDAVITGLAD